MKQVKIEDLQLGDLIFIRWSDASINVARLPTDHEIEEPVHAVGIFLGVRGIKRKHLVLGRSKMKDPQVWEADRIPLTLIDYILLVQREFLDLVLPTAKVELKKLKICAAGGAWRIVKVITR